MLARDERTACEVERARSRGERADRQIRGAKQNRALVTAERLVEAQQGSASRVLGVFCLNARYVYRYHSGHMIPVRFKTGSRPMHFGLQDTPASALGPMKHHFKIKSEMLMSSQLPP